jgi:predicted RNase H-like nuclease (RuvC/YqgF family)
MTDKKEIIIDGVDVSGCEYYDQGICNIPDVIETYDSCIDKGACYFKQLQRKEKECEEVSNEIVELNVKYETVVNLAKKNADANEYCLQELEKENQKLKQALDEIEKMIESIITDCDPITPNYRLNQINDRAYDILDIIRKAKGEEE